MCKSVIYLGAKEHRINDNRFMFTYNDIINYLGIDLCCDMLDVDLTNYDILIATPPCNYYSRANRWWRTSKVALETKHLLPDILNKFILSGKPFLVENTWSHRCPIDVRCFTYFYGSHIFYSNLFLPLGVLPKYEYQYIQTKKRYGHRDNNINIHRVIDLFLENCL